MKFEPQIERKTKAEEKEEKGAKEETEMMASDVDGGRRRMGRGRPILKPTSDSAFFFEERRRRGSGAFGSGAGIGTPERT